MAEDKKTPEVERWLKVIAEYDKEFSKWEKRTVKIIKRYRDERTASNDSSAKYNILWTNIQTLFPACYAKVPSPDVTRRFSDKDDVGRVAATILMRALEFEMHHYGDFGSTMHSAVMDRFLGGRGTAWVRYEPEFEQQEVEAEEDGGEDEDGVLVDEKSPVDYVNWQDFGHNVARTWEEVTSVWRMVYMSRKALVKRFGEEIGNAIPLDASPTDPLNKANGSAKKALVYEIWDKENEEVLWIAKSHPEVLDKKEDPLGLEEFFPCPCPLYSTITSDSLIPIPDFVQYQDQAKELDTISDRIDGLVKALKVAGVYDASVPELQRLLTEGTNNTLIPVKNWGGLSEKGGLKGAIDLVPLDVIATTLQNLYIAQKACKDEIAYILGLADIVHGVGEAGETATAQGIKGNYVGLRLNCAQGAVAKFASDIIRIKAQMVANYQDKTLLSISAVDQLSETDQQFVPQALALIRNKPLRTFRIEVDADSMVSIDEAQEKADRIEFIQAFSSLMQNAVPLLESQPQAAPMVIEIVKFGIGAYKGARSIEGQLDSQLDKIAQMEQQAAGQQKPDPEMMKIQAQQQADQQSKQMEFEFEQQKLQIQVQADERKEQLQAQQVQLQNQIEAERAQLQAENEAKLKEMEHQHEVVMLQMQQAFDKWKEELHASTTIAAAEISAKLAAANAANAANAKVQKDLTGA